MSLQAHSVAKILGRTNQSDTQLEQGENECSVAMDEAMC
jgi:hypothetical protein